MSEDVTSTRKSARASTASGKRKAADEGSDEQLKKKMKALEDKIKQLSGTNTALTDTVRALQKEKASTRHHTGDEGNSSEADSSEDDSPMLFSARKITVTGRSNPDATRPQKRQPQSDKGGPPSRHQDLPSQHRDLSPPPDPSERVTTPDINHPGRISPCSPTPLLPSRNPPPSSPKAAPPPSQLTTLPPHPWLPAPLAPGVDPKVPRTANRVYESVVASMLTEAQHKFECLLFVENAYPSIDTQIRWSIQCWEAVCATSQRYFELSKEMRNLIKGRCSHGRGAVLQRVRPVIEASFNMNAASAAAVRKNVTLANGLLTNNGFYFVDGVQGRRRFENRTMLHALQRAFFGGPKSYAALNRTKFDPIPLGSIALVCTIIEHCLREWESGAQVQVNLDETVDAPRYRTHMANATTWKELNDDVTTRIRKHISNKLFNSCGPKKPVATTGSISQETLDEERETLAERRTIYDTEEEV